MRGFTAAVFLLTLAALIPFWVVAGTEPAGHAVLWVLYGVLITSGVLFLATYREQVWARVQGRRGKESPSPAFEGAGVLADIQHLEGCPRNRARMERGPRNASGTA